jgi:hypothetical protein
VLRIVTYSSSAAWSSTFVRAHDAHKLYHAIAAVQCPCRHSQALQAQLQRFQQKENTSSSSSNLKPEVVAAAASAANASAELSPGPVDNHVAEARAITIAR